jgi:hypothetical protein
LRRNYGELNRKGEFPLVAHFAVQHVVGSELSEERHTVDDAERLNVNKTGAEFCHLAAVHESLHGPERSFASVLRHRTTIENRCLGSGLDDDRTILWQQEFLIDQAARRDPNAVNVILPILVSLRNG